MDDLLKFFPEAEQEVAQLDEVFAALLSAGIPFVESEEETDEEEKTSASLEAAITHKLREDDHASASLDHTVEHIEQQIIFGAADLTAFLALQETWIAANLAQFQ